MSNWAHVLIEQVIVQRIYSEQEDLHALCTHHPLFKPVLNQCEWATHCLET